jgi:aminopeptidase
VDVDADQGGETLRTMLGRDEGARRLGEVALVDGEGRIGALDTTFYDTLLDENAASHIALGQGFPFVVDESDHARVNQSALHIDFMIGSPEVSVSGIDADGESVPILQQGHWQI